MIISNKAKKIFKILKTIIKKDSKNITKNQIISNLVNMKVIGENVLCSWIKLMLNIMKKMSNKMQLLWK